MLKGLSILDALERPDGQLLEAAMTPAESPERKVSGGHGGRVTPVPIPNTEVKPASADGTWGETPWESRTSPEFLEERPPPRWGALPRSTLPAPSPPTDAATRVRWADAPGCAGEAQGR